MQGVYGTLAERVFDIDTAQDDVGNLAMALAEIQDPSTNTPEDVTKLTRREAEKSVSPFTLERYPSPANAKAWTIHSVLPSTAPTGETHKPRISETGKRLNAKARPFPTS